MSAPRGYNRYRGRNPLWKKVVAVLLILVIILAVAFMVLQDRVFYDDSGTPHLPRPAGQAEVSGSQPVNPGDLDITVEQMEPEKAPLRAAELTELPPGETDIFRAMPAGEFDALAVTVKDGAGRVYYTSPEQQASIAALTGSEYRTIARMSCFLDPGTARADVEGMGLKNTGGYLFYDGNNANWLDPGKPAARQYLCGIAAELADLGFDELLLTDVSYPTEGKIDKIDYGETLKSAALADFLREVRTAVGEDVTVSIELPAETILSGSEPVSGIVLADLAPLADRIYAVTDAASAPALEQALQAACGTTEFAAEVTDAAGVEGSFLLVQ
ncbi:putative glycoside hydrolase [Dysosmobacter sp.]|uniref:putative glycoside hydrolase n=1 Tax=Dysosmobacter sp. TaxID=2591382 RepID=UPI002A8C97FA|nr:putative glycoside hydrolase [Dysosmobacter sp.]MDY3281822.1 putative glycoside hydrolase [Dysosmobacter sp.]